MYTYINNRFIDELMPNLAPPEFAVMLVIFRKTEGEGLPSASIGLSDFESVTGLTRPTIVKAIGGLIDLGLIEVTKTPPRKAVYTPASMSGDISTIKANLLARKGTKNG
jgi:DNA-binding MarR family transcriptional regulator